MKRNIAEFVAYCLDYQHVKVEHQNPEGLSQDITTPTWKFCLFFPNKFDDVSITVVFEQIDHPELELTYSLYVEMELLDEHRTTNMYKMHSK